MESYYWREIIIAKESLLIRITRRKSVRQKTDRQQRPPLTMGTKAAAGTTLLIPYNTLRHSTATHQIERAIIGRQQVQNSSSDLPRSCFLLQHIVVTMGSADRPISSVLSPPPPPPPLPCDLIIVQVYGVTVNIYKDIFDVSPDADQQELYDAYNRIKKVEQIKLDKLAVEYGNNPSKQNAEKRMKSMLRRDAILKAYQVVSDDCKRTQYAKAIGLLPKLSPGADVKQSAERDANLVDDDGDNDDDEIFSEDSDLAIHDCKIQFATSNEIYTPKHKKEKETPIVSTEEQIPHDTNVRSLEKDSGEEIRFEDESNHDESNNLASPTGVSEFDDSSSIDQISQMLGGPKKAKKKSSPSDEEKPFIKIIVYDDEVDFDCDDSIVSYYEFGKEISPMARLRKDKENNHHLQSVEDERSTSTEEDELSADATPYNCNPFIESAIDMNLCHGW